MPLASKLFRNDPALQQCLVQDAAHVTPGASGDHVGLIQTALFLIDKLPILQAELTGQRFGNATAAAVLAYKRKRSIINLTYQTQPDNIVGKMTIASLDAEMLRKEAAAVAPPDRSTFAWTTRRN